MTYTMPYYTWYVYMHTCNYVVNSCVTLYRTFFIIYVMFYILSVLYDNTCNAFVSV